MNNIVKALSALATDIGTVTPQNRNPRRGDVEAVGRSLKRFGQDKPIVARADTGEIIKGNHTHAAAVTLGWTEIAVVFIHDESEIESTARGIADNRTSDLARYDHQALADAMTEVADFDVALLEATSFTEGDLADLLEFIDPDKGKSDNGDGGDDNGGADETTVCPECGHIF